MAFINGKEVLFSASGNLVVDETALYGIALRDGQRTTVEYLFFCWLCEYIRPPYKVIGKTRSIQAFSQNTELKKIEKKYFDFSGYNASDTASTNGHYSTCYNCTSLEVFEDIGLTAGYYYQTWGSCEKLHTIELVRSRKTTKYYSAWAYCYELAHIRFEGEIGESLAFESCGKLTVESVVDILQHLYNYDGSADAGKYTITLHDNVKTRMAEQGAMAELDGKTYDAYITDKGWNLA